MDEPNLLLDLAVQEELFKESYKTTSESEFATANKDLFLCCHLGLYLTQEIDEMIFQTQKMASDHAKLVSEFQELKNSEQSKANTSRTKPAQTSDYNSVKNNLEEINEINSFNIQEPVQYSIRRSMSNETLDFVDDASTLDAQELHNDIQLVQVAQLKISKLEGMLDNERAKYRSLMTEYSYKLKDVSKRLGSCVNKARPYFDALQTSKKYQYKAQKVAVEYKKSVNLHKAARDIVKITEERVMNAPDKLNPSWQEMLNQSNIKVIEATTAKNSAHQTHLRATKNYQAAEDNRILLLSNLQKYVTKSKPYFDIQKEFQEKLEVSAKKLNLLEVKLLEAQQHYNLSLNQLKNFGTQNNEGRGLTERGVGVGSENPFTTSAAAVLPKPAMDFLKENSVMLKFEMPNSSLTKLTYDPTYLDSDSDNPLEESDDYILDF